MPIPTMYHGRDNALRGVEELFLLHPHVIMKTETTQHPHLNRRKFLQIVGVAGAAGAGWALGLYRPGDHYKVVQKSQPMMGTILNLTLYGPEQSALEDAVEATIQRMLTLEKYLSRHDRQSQIAKLNRTGLLPRPEQDVVNVLKLAEHISTATEGAFDITVLPLLELQQNSTNPQQAAIAQALSLTGFQHVSIDQTAISLKYRGMGVTLDGIGKGYIVDQGVATLKENGFATTYVEAGGDLMVSGKKPGNTLWRIGITPPRRKIREKMVVLETCNRAVATSGDYMQAYDSSFSRHHIINPKTGYSPPELASATITAPTVALADGLATAAMVMGSKKTLALLNSIPECEGYLIDKSLKHYKSANFSA
ncbi:MAG: FAD:protein FMN transferase [Desulfobulbus sp.]|nr:MAG: FAD:protein FMN transferase [Desulfobulbus sp.]